MQPHAGGIKEWDTTVDSLREWGETVVRPAAALAWEGRGDFNPGEWCQFCRARAQCTARAAKLLELEQQKGAVPARSPAQERADTGLLLTDAQIGDVLKRALELECWVKDLKDYALTASLAGREIAGWKVVEGRGSREWSNGADSAFAELQARGVNEALLWDRKPVSVAALEKTLGKKQFAELANGLWKKSPGKPTLAPETDPRKPFVPAETAFQPVETP